MNLTFTNDEDEEAKSGFYTRDVQADEREETTQQYYENGKRRRRWFSFKKRTQGSHRDYYEYRQHQQDQHLLLNSQSAIIQTGKGQGKMLDEQDYGKSEENLFIESFVKECMRESMRDHKNKSKERLDSTQQYDSTEDNNYKTTERESEASPTSFINSRERKPIARSVTLQNSHMSGNRAQRNENKEDRRETIPRRGNSDAQVDAERKKNRRPHSHFSDGRDIADITERQKRASERISSYYEKPTANGNVSSDDFKNNNNKKQNGNPKKHSKRDKDYENDSEHGSTLSAFALVPGTDLQRKLSQRGISDKASIDIIKQTTTTTSTTTNSKQRADRKYPPPSSSRSSKYGNNRRSFHSVDNIYASSCSSAAHSANKRHSSHMTPNLHNSFSADNIDDQGNFFKPLKNPTGNAPPATFMVTSTPREVEAVPEEQEEESYATYV